MSRSMECLDRRHMSVLGSASGYFRGRTQLLSAPQKSMAYGGSSASRHPIFAHLFHVLRHALACPSAIGVSYSIHFLHRLRCDLDL